MKTTVLGVDDRSSGGAKWADERDDDFVLLKGDNWKGKVFETETDENGIRTVTSFTENSQGQLMKVTKRIRSGLHSYRLNKNVERRKEGITKFGSNVENGSQQPTVQERNQVEIDVPKDSAFARMLQDKEAEEEWYSYEHKKESVYRIKHQQLGGGLGEMGEDRSRLDRRLGGDTGGGDPSMGGRGGRTDGFQRDDCTVRVTNLSEDVRDEDLRELFSPVGKVQRIFLAKQKDSGQSKGFAFITFLDHKDAAKAIKVLDKHGYDHLILQVEWAKPNRPHSTALTA